MTAPGAASPTKRQSGEHDQGERRWILVGCLTTGATAALTASQGGYFPASWGWASAWFLLLVMTWLLTGPQTEAGWADLTFVALLGLLTLWTGLSVAWSIAPAQTVLDLERALVLVTGVIAFLALARRSDVSRLLGILLVGIVAVSSYGLGTRLFPNRLGDFDPIAVYRLSAPIGYWNGLGIFAVLGLLLALGVAVDGARFWARVAAAAAAVPLSLTLYFTYSRGAWIALLVGLTLLLTVSSVRQRSLVWFAVLATPSGLAVLLASRSEALTRQNTALVEAVSDGRRLAAFAVLLSGATALAAGMLVAAERRVRVPGSVRMVFTVAVAGAMLAGATAIVDRYGDPVSVVRDAWAAFEAPPPAVAGDLNRRIFSFSGNGRVDLWRAAVDVYGEHRALGSGAGTFEREYQRREDTTFKVRDAHGLYVETLAELGPLGLALLLAALSVPLWAGVAARKSRVVPGALGAYTAFLVHAGVDWDWELAGVTLTALLIGCGLLVAARRGTTREVPQRARAAGIAIAAVLTVVALGGLLGNNALATARAAKDEQDYARAVEHADRARVFMPWSPWPWIVRGDALAADGARDEAAMSFRRAIETDPGEWRSWAELALVTDGQGSTRALSRAMELYPTNQELREIERRRAQANR